MKEAGRHQHIPVASDELPPRHRLLALRSGWDALALEDIAHGLITDRIAEMFQGPLNAVIAPRAILSGHADYQVFNLSVNAGTPHRLTWFRDIHLPVSELATPGNNGVGLGNRGDLSQGFAT
jgi:hypothetical protein